MNNEKLKKYLNKKTAIILIAAGIIIILLSEFIPSSSSGTATTKVEEITSAEYVQRLENKLKGIITQIDGAGTCEVMITVSDNGEKTYATEGKSTSNESTDKSGTNEKSEQKSESEKNYVVVDGENGDTLVMVKECLPEITGVLVVCEGGTNSIVENNITNAVSVLLGIPAKDVCVYKKAE